MYCWSILTIAHRWVELRLWFPGICIKGPTEDTATRLTTEKLRCSLPYLPPTCCTGTTDTQEWSDHKKYSVLLLLPINFSGVDEPAVITLDWCKLWVFLRLEHQQISQHQHSMRYSPEPLRLFLILVDATEKSAGADCLIDSLFIHLSFLNRNFSPCPSCI
jgi:hypothetical protein